MTARVCVIGSLNADLVVRTPRLPAPGETILGGPFAMHLGGKGVNQAVAAARAGASVSFLGCVGDDDYGRMFAAVLTAEGIGTGSLLVRPGLPTGVGSITLAESGENTIVVAPGANSTLTTEDVDRFRPAIRDADVLILQLEVPLDTVAHAAAAARDDGTTVLLNAAPAPRRPLPPDLLASVDALIVNEVEARALSGSPSDDPEALAHALLKTAVQTLVVTAGPRGAFSLFGREPGRIPAFDARAVDTVGCGDAFVGVLATRWAEHQASSRAGIDAPGLHDALTWASAAGAIAATRHGAIPSLPRRPEIVALLKRAT